MARKNQLYTTISTAAADKHAREAEVGQMITCEKVAGLHLLKQQRGCSWRYRYADVFGKRRVVTVGKWPQMLPNEAAQIVEAWQKADVDPLRDEQARITEKRQTITEAERRTLRYYLDNYYRPHMERSWKPGNVEINYQRIAGHFADLMDRDIASISKTDIDDWQRRTEKRGRAYSTIRRSYGSLKTLLRHALKEGVIGADPLLNHRLLEPTLKDQASTNTDAKKSERRLLTDGEIQAIHAGLDLFAEEIRQQRRNSRKHGKPNLPDLDAVTYPHWFPPFCLLALHTGMRAGDLYSLNWQELNIPFARLTKVCEKTAHAARRERKPAVVDMKLNPAIKAIMADWHRDNGAPQSGLVFPSPVTGRQLDKTAHKKPWDHVKRLARLPEGLTFYSLRHHFISALLAAGVPIFTVAKLAGHKGVEMILQHYGHLCPDQATEALDIVARSIAGPATKKNSPQGG